MYGGTRHRSPFLNYLNPVLLQTKPPPWINDLVCSITRACRCAEQKWEVSKLRYDLVGMKDLLKVLNRTVKDEKSKYLSQLIAEDPHNPN